MYIIAEVAQAHDGSLGNAIAFIHAAARSKVNAIKFQMHIAEEESTEQERFRINCFPQDINRYQYWKRTSFTLNQWKIIADECRKNNIDLIVSPFSTKAVEDCQEIDVDAFKIGSGEFFNEQLVDACIQSEKKTILSTGLANWEEIGRIISKYSMHKSKLVLLHCVSNTCPINEIGINNIGEFEKRFGVETGLSDHSGDVDVALVASSRGIKYYEAHICWSRDMFGPDTGSSLTVEEFKRLTKFDTKVIQIDNVIDKDSTASELQYMKDLFGKSIVASKDLIAGTTLTENDLSYKKPAGGLTWQQRNLLIGKTLVSSVKRDEKLSQTIIK